MNYLIVHRGSNLIAGILSASIPPARSNEYKFIAANEKTLNTYFKFKTKHSDLCPDLGELIAKSKHLQDVMNPQSHSLQPTILREGRESFASSREAVIASWITLHPTANEHDLHDKFGCGVVVAKAYLNKWL